MNLQKQTPSSDEPRFGDDGRLHFEATPWQKRRTLFYANLAETFYVWSMSPSSRFPNLWRALADMCMRRVMFFSKGAIPLPKDKAHTNALREQAGFKAYEDKPDALQSMTGDWVRRVHEGEPDPADEPDMDQMLRSMNQHGN